MKFSIFNFQFSIIRSLAKRIESVKYSQGFTLIELLVVIVIIGLLSTLGMVNYLDARARARDAQRKSNLQQLQSALELYRSDQHAYPAAMPACGNALTDPGNTTTYIKKVPCDPTNSGQFTYRYTLVGATYKLISCLENANDGQKDTPKDAGCTSVSYTLASP
jgi:type II secretion system protein G